MRSVLTKAGARAAVLAADRFRRLHPDVVDAVLAVALTVFSLVWATQYHSKDAPYHPFNALGMILSVLINMSVAFRRRATVPMLLFSCALLVVYSEIEYLPTTDPWAPLLIFYTLATRLAPARALPYAAAVLVGWLCSNLEVEVVTSLLTIAETVTAIAVTWVFADQTRQLAERNRRLAALTEQLRIEQVAKAERAVAMERVRIARELHDVVAHHMSVISVQVGLARYVLTSDPATAGEAMATIATTTHEALDEMRRLLAVLRLGSDDDDAGGFGASPVEPSPGLDRLGELLDRMRVAGVDVGLRIVGEAVRLPSGPDLCAYRVVQESLTNVLKHAGPTTAAVELHYQAHDVVLRIADDGPRTVGSPETGATGPDTGRDAGDDAGGRGEGHGGDGDDAGRDAERPPGSGNGLVGMRERARIYGGTLTAGRRPGGGFEVVLTLPS